MSRCRICDWSPNAPQSDYYLGSVTRSRSRKLLLDNETNDTICTSCATVIAIDLSQKDINGK